MNLPIQLISTDFDGTIFAEFESPPVPRRLQEKIAALQAEGVKWVVNTGRDMASLMEVMGRAHLSVKPDYLVLVEREIHVHRDSEYIGLPEWNTRCAAAHEALFQKIRPRLPEVTAWIRARHTATIYEDVFSPFCMIADNNREADAILDFLHDYFRKIQELTIVRNDIYARFSHIAYNKGSALREIARQLGVRREFILAAGDHFNDLPMLSEDVAAFLVAPANAIPAVKETVRRQNGYVSPCARGHGVADGIDFFLEEFAEI